MENNNTTQLNKIKIEIDVKPKLYKKLNAFSEFIGYSIEDFIVFCCKKELIHYENALDSGTGVMEYLFEDFFEDQFREKLKAIFVGDKE